MWHPILEGPLRNRAALAVSRVADAILAARGQGVAPAQEALFWAYYIDHCDTSGDNPGSLVDDAYNDVVVNASRLVTVDAPSLQLYNHSVGTAWTLAHITDEDGAALLSKIDAHILAAVDGNARWDQSFDLVQGIVGVGVYALERHRRGDVAFSLPCLSAIVAQLDAISRCKGDHRWWHTGKDILADEFHATFPDGYIDCGAAHGMPSVIAFLAAAGAAGVPNASIMSRQANAWLLAQRFQSADVNRYPTVVQPAVPPSPSVTSAWCYGDLGAIACQWAAARALGDDETPYLAHALECAQRPSALAALPDAALCHGALGVAHLYNRFYQASGRNEFRDVARHHIEQGLAMQDPQYSFGGFAGRYWSDAAPDVPIFTANPTFLEGSIGIALALIAACSATEPAWDRLMAIDIACTATPVI